MADETIDELRELIRRCRIKVTYAELALEIAEEALASVQQRLSKRRMPFTSTMKERID